MGGGGAAAALRLIVPDTNFRKQDDRHFTQRRSESGVADNDESIGEQDGRRTMSFFVKGGNPTALPPGFRRLVTSAVGVSTFT